MCIAMKKQPPCALQYTCMCQSRVEIEYYSVVYFDRVTAFKVPYMYL